jgi:tRNA U34 5-methylaminomethyl-2-thiouridine-forming methyltransferase MnmC
VPNPAPYRIVRLRNGVHSVYSERYDETMHPGIGPAAEAEALYVRQLRLAERLATHAGEFVTWDVGLGAAANALAVLRATRAFPRPIRIVSFDDTLDPLRIALQNAAVLGYLNGYETALQELIRSGHAEFRDGSRAVCWQLQLADFPRLLQRWTEGAGRTRPAAPHAILFDPFSPSRNPSMWTLPVFDRLRRALEPGQPCSLATYSRSTLLRVTLLLAGFFVGHGLATGLKEETTVAASHRELIDAPLDAGWLKRARRSGSAEPLHDPVYRQAPLSPETWERLRLHPQFA